MQSFSIGPLFATILTTACAVAHGEAIPDAALDLRFEKTWTNRVQDSGPAALEVQIVGKPAPVPGKHGQGMRFSGAEYLEIASCDAVSFHDSFTVELWVRPASVGGPRLLFGWGRRLIARTPILLLLALSLFQGRWEHSGRTP